MPIHQLCLREGGRQPGEMGKRREGKVKAPSRPRRKIPSQTWFYGLTEPAEPGQEPLGATWLGQTGHPGFFLEPRVATPLHSGRPPRNLVLAPVAPQSLLGTWLRSGLFPKSAWPVTQPQQTGFKFGLHLIAVLPP
jgi:hypothetical protein